MLETFEVSKVLIIAPLRVARDTWPAEIEKWNHLQGLDISVIVGDTKTRIAALHHPAMIYVINRENIKWLVEYYEKNGMRWDFGMVVIDELSSFKNYQSQRFKFLRKVRPYVKRWVGLTGTPSSNGLMDLWAEIGILDGGERLGKFIGRYREAYFMFILYGATSRNGKGTAMETFLKIMGDYGKTSNPDMLAAKFRGGNTGGPSEEVARLVGSRFVNISEPEKKITFNAALVA